MHHKRHQNAFYLQVNIIVSSSRGGPLTRRLSPGTTVNSTRGGKLKGLTNTAVRLLPPPHRLPNKTRLFCLRRSGHYGENRFHQQTALPLQGNNICQRPSHHDRKSKNPIRNYPERNFAAWCCPNICNNSQIQPINLQFVSKENKSHLCSLPHRSLQRDA